MVLNELGAKITGALAAMSNQMVIDEKVLDACLKEICSALLQSDVNVRLVAGQAAAAAMQQQQQQQHHAGMRVTVAYITAA
jgi:signal recognition particle GTPase